ncbi:MAG: flagellar biosynthesis protein FliQ [Ignavibacteriae bacterium]|nr:flagellar biosynthesis protein FliQ [Ignavibacteriota bacterium]
MNTDFVVNLFREAFYTAMLVSAPVLLVSLLVGLVISVLQAATSIQEFTLSFVPKLLAIAVVLVLTMPWMIDTIVAFTTNLFQQIPSIVR